MDEAKPKNRRLIIEAFVLLACIALAFYFGRTTAAPWEERAFLRNRRVFDNFVSSSLIQVSDSDSITLTPELLDVGINRIKKEGSAIEFVFPTLPPDSIHELVYLKEAFDNPILKFTEDSSRLWIYMKKLDDNWFYCIYDLK